METNDLSRSFFFSIRAEVLTKLETETREKYETSKKRNAELAKRLNRLPINCKCRIPAIGLSNAKDSTLFRSSKRRRKDDDPSRNRQYASPRARRGDLKRIRNKSLESRSRLRQRILIRFADCDRVGDLLAHEFRHQIEGVGAEDWSEFRSYISRTRSNTLVW